MTKEKLGNELLYSRIGYKVDRWKWVLDRLPKTIDISNQDDLSTDPVLSAQDLQELDLIRAYGLDKVPKSLPCPKRCSQNVWCLASLKAASAAGKSGSRVPLHQQERTDLNMPVGLQNTANTCWINSALQLFYQLRKFRIAINSVEDFDGDQTLDSLVYLLQVVFAEMESHPFKAMACKAGSVFEKLGMFASREVMKKDANNELLKCVSEFMENTIDLLLADSRLASQVAPLFTISLTRLARWQCSKCSRVHEYELSPASSFTMGAYISADQAPLQQCLMDLQAETQTGVLMVCGGSDSGSLNASLSGCGSTVKVDRVVTPKLRSLPAYLIIRNNSLVSDDVKRRLHVVYPELLDLSSHTLDGQPALYQLTGVVFHHGYWAKHYSAQVKTDDGNWFSFNDEEVMEMSFKAAAASQSNPQENHPNYFSLGSVSAKYKSKDGERVSRGAFIWLYSLMEDAPAPPLLPPPQPVLEFISHRRTLQQDDNSRLLADIQSERQSLVEELAVTDPNEPYTAMSEALLLAWLSSEEREFSAQSCTLPPLRCAHGRLKPLLGHAVKCVRTEALQQLLTHRCGIHVAHRTLLAVTHNSTKTSCQGDSPSRVAESSGCSQSMNGSMKTSSFNGFREKESDSKMNDSDVASSTGSPNSTLPHDVINGVSTRVADTQDASLSETAMETSGVLKLLQTFPYTEHQCRECVAKHARHILFLEKLRMLHKLYKKEALQQYSEGLKAVGAVSLDLWPKLAARLYVKHHGIDMSYDAFSDLAESVGEKDEPAVEEAANQSNDVTESKPDLESDASRLCSDAQADQQDKPDSSLGFKLFNEDIVCSHNQFNTQASVFYLPVASYNTILRLLGDDVHPATVLDDFEPCLECQQVLVETETACELGASQRNKLPALFADKKRPSLTRDCGSRVFLLDRDVFNDWRTYVRGCVKGVPEKKPHFSNEDLLCVHRKLNYNPSILDPARFSRLWVLVWPEEWTIIEQLYGSMASSAIQATISSDGLIDIIPDVCNEGCVESQALLDYEDLFEYQNEVIYVRQVHSEDDIPQRAVAGTRSMGPAPTPPCVVTSSQDLVSASRKNLNKPGNVSCAAMDDRQTTSSDLSGSDLKCDAGVDGGPQACGTATLEGNEKRPLDESSVQGSSGSRKIARLETVQNGTSTNGAIMPPAAGESSISSAGAQSGDSAICLSRPAAVASDESVSSSVSSTTSKCSKTRDGGDAVTHSPPAIAPPSSADAAVPACTPSQPVVSGNSRQSGRRRCPKGGAQTKVATARLVRASQYFASTDTIRQVQNFIAEKTGVWPMLQTVWLVWSEDLAAAVSLPPVPAPVLLGEEHLTMTLGALRVRPGDTIYFKAAKEDLEKAAGDGIIEYEEISA
ncbi:ubiquitin carboxyl-terminal hydrolase 48 [Hyalella azteca]|uniref:Ubiquitin carboxyl-terminal hydrolase 48 n=1 Tax=Hyalella azteca TaxID=294128 RepID=A0A8B7NVB0_HYAAZ|nr:ubiquitin carboxyl-terminal hydrolase 48 [Hyalella azteca]